MATCTLAACPWCRVGVALFLVAPLSLLRDIGLLSYTSVLCFLVMLLFCAFSLTVWASGAVACTIATAAPAQAAPLVPLTTTWQAARQAGAESCDFHAGFSLTLQTAFVLPTMCFSFVCHTALLPIYAELRRPAPSLAASASASSSARGAQLQAAGVRVLRGPRAEGSKKDVMFAVGLRAIVISFVLYAVAGVSGYATFKQAVSSDALFGYQQLFAVAPGPPGGGHQHNHSSSKRWRGADEGSQGEPTPCTCAPSAHGGAELQPLKRATLTLYVLYCLAVACTVPVILFPARKAVQLNLFHGWPFTWRRHVAIGFGFTAAITLAAISPVARHLKARPRPPLLVPRARTGLPLFAHAPLTN